MSIKKELQAERKEEATANRKEHMQEIGTPSPEKPNQAIPARALSAQERKYQRVKKAVNAYGFWLLDAMLDENPEIQMSAAHVVRAQAISTRLLTWAKGSKPGPLVAFLDVAADQAALELLGNK